MAKCPLLDLILLDLQPFCIKSLNWHTRLQKFKTDFFSCTRRAFKNQLLTTPNVLHLVLTPTFSTMVSLFWKSCSCWELKGKKFTFSLENVIKTDGEYVLFWREKSSFTQLRPLLFWYDGPLTPLTVASLVKIKWS